MENYLLCCDWGTSSFRLRLVDKNLNVHHEIKSDAGISKIFNAWKNGDDQKPLSRFDFYVQKLKEQIDSLARIASATLSHIPIIISGMASSSIGMEELPYATLPFTVNGSQASVRFFEETHNLPHPIILISGLRSEDDVMRGEETQLIGLFKLQESQLPSAAPAVIIFPGTHSKHVYVQDNSIVGFSTFMTGELFQILSSFSILKDSVHSINHAEWNNSNKTDAFRKGVQESASLSLLHSLFKVRTNQLFEKLTKEENYFYLSGLLIGTELRSLYGKDDSSLFISSSDHLFAPYKIAAEKLDGESRTTFIPSSLVDKATIAGQVQIFKEFSATKKYD